MQDSTAYIGLEVHSRTCTMAWINEEGTCRELCTFQTSGENLREKVGSIRAGEKTLALEEGPLVFWTARTLEEIVSQIVVCDPQENDLISRSARKDDEADVKALARLLRLGEVKEVYQPENDHRALKKKIKARLKQWGLWNIPSAEVYSKSGYFTAVCKGLHSLTGE